MTQAYPLSWPDGFPRSKSRQSGKFKTTLHKAVSNVRKSLDLFAADSGLKIEGVVISSNATLGVEKPADPGVAVWFHWNGAQVCVPVDRYHLLADNLQAIHHILEARRTELRHGGLAIVKATFAGFKALPAPGGSWRQQFGFAVESRPNLAEVEATFRKLANQFHPDKPGGSTARMAELNAALREARSELEPRA